MCYWYSVFITTPEWTVKIRVKIGATHHLTSCKRRLNGAALQMRPKKKPWDPMSLQLWHDNDSSLPKSVWSTKNINLVWNNGKSFGRLIDWLIIWGFTTRSRIFHLQTLKRASTPVARYGTVRFRHGTVRFLHGTVRFLHGTVRFLHGTVRFLHGTVRFLHGMVRFLHGTVHFVHGTLCENLLHAM
jgi:hypothetical protein